MPEDPAEIERRISYRDIDGVLHTATIKEIAQAWCRYSGRMRRGEIKQRPRVTSLQELSDLPEEDEDPDWWAVELFHSDLMRETLSEATRRALIAALADEAPDDATLGHIGAGPLEDFVTYHDEGRIAWIEEQAELAPKFREALSNVWIWDAPDWVWDRIERAAGVPLPRPRDGPRSDQSHD
jgi:hypothetical protein